MGFSRQECWSGVPLPSPLEYEAALMPGNVTAAESRVKKNVLTLAANIGHCSYSHLHLFTVCPTFKLVSPDFGENPSSLWECYLHRQVFLQEDLLTLFSKE